MNYPLLIEKAINRGIEAVEIYIQHQQGMSITLYEGNVDKYTVNDVKAMSVRGIYQNHMGNVSVEKFADSEIDALLDALIDNALSITIEQPEFIFEGSEYPTSKRKADDFTVIPGHKKIQRLQDLEKTLLNKDSRVSKVASANYVETNVNVSIINSKGLSLQKSETYAYIMASAVFQENGDVKSNMDYQMVLKDRDFDLEELASLIVKRGVAKLHGAPVATNAYPVIFENKAFASLLSAFTSVFSGEAAVKNLTQLKEKVGQTIAHKSFTLIDDPLHKDAPFTNTFDDEGVACFKKTIINKGKLVTLLHNLKTANLLQSASTGNGFKSSITSPVGVLPSNLYVKPGKEALAELIATTQNGLFITDMQGLHAGINTISGNFSLQSSGFKIENGQITDPVTLIVVSGNFFDMIQDIEGIASDLYFSLAGTGSPSIKIASLQVSGK